MLFKCIEFQPKFYTNLNPENALKLKEIVPQKFQNVWVWSGAKVGKIASILYVLKNVMMQNYPLVVEIGFDRADNGPSLVCYR